MAENKKSFVLYADLLKSIEHLTNEEKGILFNHLLEYVNDMNPSLDDRLILTAWKPIELQLKRDLVKFEEVKAKRSEAGKRSAELRALKSTEHNSTNPTSVESVQECSTKSTVNDTVNENENDTVILLEKETKGSEFFNLEPSHDKLPSGDTSKKVAPKKVSVHQLIMPEDYRELWNEWTEYRKDRKLKPYAGIKWEQKALDKLLELSDRDPTTARQILETTYQNNYQGFFPLKNNSKNNGSANNTRINGRSSITPGTVTPEFT